MFIVLEGCDCTGKTSLASHLAQRYGLEVVKFSKPTKEAYLEYMEFLLKRDQPAILDRFYLGEEVYGPIWRGRSSLNEWQLRNIEEILQMRVPFTIYCCTDGAEIAHRFKTRGEDLAKPEEIEPILDGFSKATKKSRFNWWKFDYRKDPLYIDLDQALDVWVKQVGDNFNQIQRLIKNRTKGDFFAKTLIVGEICNYKLEKKQYQHVVVPFGNGPSANILYEALNGRTDYALSNVFKGHLNDGYGDFEAELSLPNIERVVCLGNNALNKTIDFLKGRFKHLTFSRVRHPAFIARQSSITMEDYRRMLL